MLSPHIKRFLKLKRGLELVSLPHFLNNFSRKFLYFSVLLIDQISLPGCLYFVRYLLIYVLQLFITICVLQHLKNKKNFYDEIKEFFIIFNGLSIKQITQIFFRRLESGFNYVGGGQEGSCQGHEIC